MFDSKPHPSKSSERIPPALYEDHSFTSLKDSISSITYRISEIQASLSRKIDRSQCMGIFDKKVGLSHLRHYLDDFEVKIKEEQKTEEERNNKMQEIAIQKINQLGQKIKSINENVSKSESKSKNKNPIRSKQAVIKPQQLFLESNETMFSLIIDEIAKLQEKNTDFQKQLQNRNRKVISLNNEVCKKIEKLENQIEEKLHSKVVMTEPVQAKYFGSSWSQMDRNNKPTIHKGSEMDGSTFQSIRLELISKNIEALQKEMLAKINIKDILPIIRQNTQSFTDSTQELRDYIEESIDSMRKILSSQTQINRQLSLGIRSGWWHSFSQENEIAIINKELINLVPQIFEIPSSKNYNNYINIAQQGLYIIKIYPLLHINNFLSDHSTISENQPGEYQVMIGTEVHILGNESALRLEKNSEIRIILRSHAEIIICIQKI